MSDLGLEKGNKGAALFLRRQQAAEQSAIVKEAEASKSDAVNTTRSTFQDPINSKAGIVRKSSFRSSLKEATPPPVRPQSVSKPPKSATPDTGSAQISRQQKEIPEVTQSIATETLENTSSMLNQVAGKLSSLKNDDDVFTLDQDFAQRMDENGEIVYDDPGSVKDIRKKFGVRTNPEFAQPKTKLSSGRNSRSSSIAQEPQSLNSSFTSESPKRLSQHRYSTEADKIFKEAIDQTSRPVSEASLPPVDRLPPRPKPKPKPKPTVDKKPSRPSSTSIPAYLQTENQDILSKIENINKMTMNYESFEAAIADFYVSVAKLDPTVTPPIVG